MSVWDFLDKLTPLLMGPVCLISQGWFEEPVRPWAGSGRLSVQADSLRNGKSPEQPYVAIHNTARQAAIRPPQNTFSASASLRILSGGRDMADSDFLEMRTPPRPLPRPRKKLERNIASFQTD